MDYCWLAARRCCCRRYADEGMWTFDNFPSATVKAAVRRGHHTRLARSRATLHDSPRELHRLLRIARWPDADQSPLRRDLPRASYPPKNKSLMERGFAAPDREARSGAAHAAGGRAGRHGEHHRCGAQVRARALRDEAANRRERRSSPRSNKPASKRARRPNPASSYARRSRSTREASTSSTSTSAMTTCAWCSLRKPISPRSGAIRTIFNFRAGLSISRYCVPMRTASPRRRRIIYRSTLPDPAPTNWCSSPGDPGSTARLQTRAQLQFERDISLPISLMRASELRGRYIQFGKANPADERIVEAPLNSLQNGIKVRRKQLDALNDDALLRGEIRQRNRSCGAAPSCPARIRGARSKSALTRERALYVPYTFIENGAGFNSTLFRDARLLVRGADERVEAQQ